MQKISDLKITFVISVAAHAFVAWFLFHSVAKTYRPSVKGVVSIEFIQSVDHTESNHESSPEPRPDDVKITRQRQEKPKQIQTRETVTEQQLKPNSLSDSPLKGEVGDPQSRAHESDLYVAQVTQLINRHKIYPRMAIDREEEGRVVVAVTLARDGTIIDSRVEEPSPFDRLNKAALQAISSISRFPTLPASISSPMHLHIPLIYTIER